MNKLTTLTQIEGYTNEFEMAQSVMADSVCPGICMNEGCDYTTEVELDCDSGICEICNTRTVKSALSLMGII